ncbi:MAG: hypothetical protein A2Y58_03245 [Chloroflexi bacterium RBG_13_51_52]|nr:MAG: hypothetical protein A2Y58_03245 [Chloroflexi bacterium RBG_13_51_52]
MNINNIKLEHLSNVIWHCPYCYNDAIRFDIIKHVFVCWECCNIIPEEEGHRLLDGFFQTMTDDERKRYLLKDG